MSFWIREVAGWFLLLLGLYVFYRSGMLLLGPEVKYVEGGILTMMGVFLFRGGIQLLKIAVAARLCDTAQQHLEPERLRPAARPARRIPPSHVTEPVRRTEY